MKKNPVSFIYCIVGVMNLIVSLIKFSGDRISLAVTYLFLAITFISLGFSYRNKSK